MSSGKVAFLLPSLGIGGVETLSISLAREFEHQGYEIDIVLMQKRGELIDSLPKNWIVIGLNAIRIRAAVAPISTYLRDYKPDAVLVALWPLTSAALLAHRLVRSPSRIVVSDHNTLSRQYAWRGLLHRLFMRTSLATYYLADVRIAVSDGVADDVSALSGIARERFDVVHNPMPLVMGEAVDMSVAEAAWDGWIGPRIITVGRLKDQKNHPLLIRAFRKLLEQTDARLIILGTGEGESETRTAIEVEGLSGKVFMPGHTENPVPFYRSANLFVLSSDYEGFGNVIIEALACGLPVVSTDCPSGPAEILKNGRFGRLTPVGDADALAEAMHDTLAVYHDSDALKRRAQDFAPDIVAEKYLKLLFPYKSDA